MAVDKTKFVPKSVTASGWGSAENIYTGTNGVIIGRINPTLNIAILQWGGNTNTPSSETISADLPVKYVPVGSNYIATLRNADYIEARTDGTVKVQLKTTAWSGGSVMYPVK